jgi:hypothetical protein
MLLLYLFLKIISESVTIQNIFTNGSEPEVSDAFLQLKEDSFTRFQ